MKHLTNILLAVTAILSLTMCGRKMSEGTAANDAPGKYSAYLFAYFTGNSKTDEAIHFALSSDGYNYRALNHDQPIISSQQISSTGGVRDPHILRGADGKTFYMVATDMVSANGWNSNRAMVLLKSTDLINWTSSIVNIQQKYSGQDSLLRVWAPQTIYDAKKKKYMIYWSMKYGSGPDIIYYSYANKEFTDLATEPKQLFYHPENKSCIDGDIEYAFGKYHLFFKTEGHGNGIMKAVSDQLTTGYQMQDKYLQQTTDPVEGAGTFKLIGSDAWVLMYDVYTKGKYQFTKSTDLQNFSVVDNDVSMNFHPRHGTIIRITNEEAERLMGKWGNAGDALQSASASAIKKINISFDSATNTVMLPLKPRTNNTSFNPGFMAQPGLTISPAGNQNFSNGPVKYTVAISGQQPQTFNVIAKETHNPVLQGYYADPDVMYSEKTGKYYIYPTSDGFTGWSGTYFKTFSSPDLVNWTDEGKILDLEKDVSWANRNAWAPTILEKYMDGKYRYFFYFTAAQKIGVAVADDPTGPFVDHGQPLIDKRPDGKNGGQQIDPDVFTDPVTGKTFLYWGNGYMAVAELNDDLVSIKPGNVKTITPDKTFREGTTVFFRNGLYYFLWSENDTRDPNYRVRYGTSTSPTGKIEIPAKNIVIEKDAASGIYGTGHNSILQIPDKDEWYIVYHRFNYPKGLTMGGAAGYNREVAIDKLEFNRDGTIKQVIPTHEGIQPLK